MTCGHIYDHFFQIGHIMVIYLRLKFFRPEISKFLIFRHENPSHKLKVTIIIIKISVRYAKIKSRFSRSVVKHYVIPSCCLALAGMARQPRGATQQEKIT